MIRWKEMPEYQSNSSSRMILHLFLPHNVSIFKLWNIEIQFFTSSPTLRTYFLDITRLDCPKIANQEKKNSTISILPTIKDRTFHKAFCYRLATQITLHYRWFSNLGPHWNIQTKLLTHHLSHANTIVC